MLILKVRLAVCAILVSIVSPASAQDSSRFTIGVLYAPEIGYRTLNSEDSLFNTIMMPFREAVEKPGYGYSIGGSVSFKVNSLIKLRSGINFHERAYRIPETPINWQGPGSGSIIRVVRYPTTVSYKEKTKIGYISIPLTLEVEVKLKRFTLGAFGGGSIDYLLYHKDRVTEYDKYGNGQSFSKNLNYLNTFKKITPNLLAGISLDYDLNKKFVFSIEPYTKRSGPAVQNPRLTAKLYSYGANLSVGVKL